MRALLLSLALASGCGGSGAWTADRVYTPPICPAGTADCDGLFSTGCETDVMEDAAHCGRCDRACGETLACIAGACDLAQAPPQE